MTQGEEHRHGAASLEFRRNLELSHRSDPAGPSGQAAVASAAAEVLLPPSHRPAVQQTHGGEDARNLLQFVHHASCDIKAVLDQGSCSHRHRKQLSPSSLNAENNSVNHDRVRTEPSPIRRFSPESMLSHHYKRYLHHPHHQHNQSLPHLSNKRENSVEESNVDKSDVSLPRNTRDGFLPQYELHHLFPEQASGSHYKVQDNSKKVDLTSQDGHSDVVNDVENSDEPTSHHDVESKTLDLFRYVDALRESNDEERKESECESSNESENMQSKGKCDEKRESRMSNAQEEGNTRLNSVPLRKRRLPASFWQEPKGKSGNHKIRPVDHGLDSQPRSFVHHPGLSLFGQLKLPIPSPLSPGRFDFDFGVGRHFGAEKNPFLFPSTSATSPFLNMPYRPHLPLSLPGATIDDRHRHGLPVPCGSNVCICHLQNLAGCPSHVCEQTSNGNLGVFGRGPTIPPISPMDASPSSALALSRWSAMQSSLTGGDGPADVLGSYPMPRVLKPIPTKSLSSYPPRFHPIFT